MPTTDTIDPVLFEVPDNQALLYSEVVDNETVYKYKLSSGAIGTINALILTTLNVDPNSLPALVYKTDLMRCVNEAFASVADLTIAVGQKASITYVNNLAAVKVNRNEFTDRVSRLASRQELETGLDTKADLDYVNTALHGKADASAVYSKDETNDLISVAVISNRTISDEVTIEGRGTDTDPLRLNSTMAREFGELKEDAHRHGNIDVLDGLDVVNDKLVYNGVVVGDVRSVNGVYPDESGNIVLEVIPGSGSDSPDQNRVISVNGVGPDANGNVQITIPTTIAELSDAASKQDTITGTEGQFVMIGQGGTVVTSSIDYCTNSQVDTKISAAIASVYKYIATVPDYTNLPVSGTAGLAIGHVYHVVTKNNKTINAEYVWNGEAWEELGSIIDFGDLPDSSFVETSISNAITQEASNRAAAIQAVDNKVTANSSAITANTNAIFTNTSNTSALDARVTLIEGDVAVLQSATVGYNGTSTISAAISTAQENAISAANTNADTKASAAETAAKSYASSLDSATNARVDTIEVNMGSRIDNAELRIGVLENRTVDSAAIIASAVESVQPSIDAKANRLQVVIVRDGTDSVPQEVALQPDTWYVVKSPFVGVLPADAPEGTYITISVAVGGNNRQVVTAENSNETINGSTDACYIGRETDGTVINLESYRFVKVESDWLTL